MVSKNLARKEGFYCGISAKNYKGPILLLENISLETPQFVGLLVRLNDNEAKDQKLIKCSFLEGLKYDT